MSSHTHHGTFGSLAHFADISKWEWRSYKIPEATRMSNLSLNQTGKLLPCRIILKTDPHQPRSSLLQQAVASEICQQEMPLGSLTNPSLEGLWEERKKGVQEEKE